AVTATWPERPPAPVAGEVRYSSGQRPVPKVSLRLVGISAGGVLVLVLLVGLAHWLRKEETRFPGERDTTEPPAAEFIPAEERFAWQPKELVGVLGSHRFRHWGGLVSVSYSSDGTNLITYGSDQYIRSWEPLTGREQAHCRVEKKWGTPLV